MLNEVAAIVAVAVLGWAAWRDIKTRRVKRYVWWPGFEIGLLFLGLHAVRLLSAPPLIQRFDGLRIGISIVFLVVTGIMFAVLRLFGWADAKAFILLGLLIPLFPTFSMLGGFPIERSVLDVFSLAAVTNGLLLTLVYPVYLAAKNSIEGTTDFPWLFLTRTVQTTNLDSAHGKLASTTSGYTANGLDLDALRMYMRWRGIELEDICSNPDNYRKTLPINTNPPTDGRIFEASLSHSNDPWGAEAFLEEHSAYGTTPAVLREGLEAVATEDTVLVMPGIPLIVSLFIGLVTAIIFGDIFTLLFL